MQKNPIIKDSRYLQTKYFRSKIRKNARIKIRQSTEPVLELKFSYRFGFLMEEHARSEENLFNEFYTKSVFSSCHPL